VTAARHIEDFDSSSRKACRLQLRTLRAAVEQPFSAHAWNLVRLYPEGRAERLSVDPPPHSTGLWLSEGVTIYYASRIEEVLAAALPLLNARPQDSAADAALSIGSAV